MEIEKEILKLAPDLSNHVGQMFSDYKELDKAVVLRLLADEMITKIVPPFVDQPTVVAVDGARVQEKLYAADLLIAVATSAEGINTGASPKNKQELTAGGNDLTEASAWASIMEPSTANPRISATAMACLEVNLLHRLTQHDVRIVDGSFLTPVLGINEGLEASQKAVRKRVYEILTSPHTNPTEALHALYCVPEVYDYSTLIVAVPKSETSTTYVDALNAEYHTEVKLRDRFFATQILRENELLKPKNITNSKNHDLHINTELTRKEKQQLEPVFDAMRQIYKRQKEHCVWFSYFKPKNSNTVLRFEFICVNDENEAMKKAHYIAAVLNNETRAPHLLEPYPQVVVDKKAKKISPSAKALSNLIVQNLTPEERKRYGHLLLQEYRT